MLGTTASMYALLRSLGRDPRLALLAVPLLTNSQFLIGLLQFLLGIPLMLWGWSLAIDSQQEGRSNRLFLLATVALLTFYSHVVPFAVFLMGLAVLAPWRSRRALLRYVLSLAPAGLALAHWALFTAAGVLVRRALTGGAEDKDFLPFGESFRDMYDLAFNTYRDSADERLFASALVVGAVLTFFARAERTGAPVTTGRWLLVPLICVVLYFRSEGTNGFVGHIRDRFSLLAALTLIPVLRMPRRVPGAIGTCAMVILSGLTVETFNWHLTRFGAVEVGDFDGALAHIPPNQRVAGLVFSGESDYFTQNPFLHYPAYYYVDKGGLVNFAFAGYPYWVTSYRPHQAPLGKSLPVYRWEWRPARVEACEELAVAYDYVLTRGFGFDPPRGCFTKTWEGNRWAVWERSVR
jgi:hypothetical protein